MENTNLKKEFIDHGYKLFLLWNCINFLKNNDVKLYIKKICINQF